MRQIDPRVRLMVNHTRETIEEVKNIAPYVDIYMPYLWDVLNDGAYADRLNVKRVSNRLLRKNDEFFWTYANPPGYWPQEAPPYRDYRLSVWRVWNLGASGFGYWILRDDNQWDNSDKSGQGWGVVYYTDIKISRAPANLTKKELVIPSKRWEATREGVEDYCCLYLLRQAVDEAGDNVPGSLLARAKDVLIRWPQKLLTTVDNPDLVDQARREILEILIQLQKTGTSTTTQPWVRPGILE
jgi:hypothetical protein